MVAEGTAKRIAIVGMACRFPGANTPEEFWQNLLDRKDCVRRFSEQELRDAGVPRHLLEDPCYVRAKAIVEGIELFDAAFFGFSPKEAEALDPQHRTLLECSYSALEAAGYDPKSMPMTVGVYAGAGEPTYLHENLSHHPDFLKTLGVMRTRIATSNHFISSLVSYKLNLTGPAVTVSTACSSALVAMHTACQALLAGECDMALAGGVTIVLPQINGYVHAEQDILSSDGRCRPFDAHATGTVPGCGGGVVALRRLDDAQRDGDPVVAVIRGTAINNDGNLKAGFSAPSVAGQVEVIRQALAAAELEPRDVSYVEAHGTGTAIGDPIEVEALREVYEGVEPRSCAIGSVKSNIGHLDTGAGIAGVIKTALALQRRLLPATLHFETPNPDLELEGSPFRVVAQTETWGHGSERMVGAVSSFGVGGTNAHAVMESFGDNETRAGQGTETVVLPFSARTPAALSQLRESMRRHLALHEHVVLEDVAYTLQVGRRAFAVRDAVACADKSDLLAWLEREPDSALRSDRPVCFELVDEGGGGELPVADLVRRFPSIRRELDAIRELDASTSGTPLVVQYVLFRLLMEMGVRPDFVIVPASGLPLAAVLAGWATSVSHFFDLERGARADVRPKVPIVFTETGEEASAARLRQWREVLRRGCADLAAVRDRHLVVDFPPLGKARPEPWNPGSVVNALQQRVSELWSNGATVNWTVLWGGKRMQRSSLPTYPFDRSRYWIEPVARAPEDREAAGDASAKDSPPQTIAQSVATKVRELLTHVTGADGLSLDTELGTVLDSVAALALVSEIRNHLGVELSMRNLLEVETVGKLVEIIERDRGRVALDGGR